MALIPADEAARILGVTKRQLHSNVRSGLLRAHYPTGASVHPSRPLYDADEVAELADIKRRGLSLAEVAMMAHRSYLLSRQLSRAVQRLMDIVGIDLELPDLSREAVSSLHLEVRDAYASLTPLVPKDVLRWAKAFYVMGEEYFAAVEEYLCLDEPWKAYLDLASKIMDGMPSKEVRASTELQAIYGTFQTSRLILRQSAYFYVRERHGKVLAAKMFPDVKGDMHEDMLALTAG
jgi:hypothetical protein